ncbi:MAG: hypothetical protein GY715_15450 [Planctomycetes bacterium]|nr:hypothetical protein [Planctomycetota bacterium]
MSGRKFPGAMLAGAGGLILVLSGNAFGATGDDCTDPIVVTLPATLPYVDVNTTLLRVDDYNETCMGLYDGGEDIIYELVVTDSICVDITLDADTIWGGVAVFSECPDTGPQSCIAQASTSSNPDVITDLALDPGTYWIMADTFATPDDMEFTLTIAECPPPPTGACCYPDGSCLDSQEESACLALFGTWQGADVLCIDVTCPVLQPISCANPIPVTVPAALPYATTDTTVDRVDHYSDTCMGSYDNGEDIMYELTVTEEVCLQITLDADTTWGGIAVFSACPDVDPQSCIAQATANVNPDVISDLTLLPGTYWLMADTFATPDNMDFTLTIEECPPPPTGACCLPNGDCMDGVTEEECGGVLEGTYKGDGTVCIEVNCEGDDCTDPIGVTLPAELPYTSVDSTVGRVDDYADTCMGSYDGGEDIIYELTVTAQVCVEISLLADNIWGGVAVFSECPDTGPQTCVALATSSANPDVISDLTLDPGTYWIMIDTFPTPNTIDFTLTIVECPPPPVGACCFSDGGCTDGLEEGDCIASLGVWQGADTDCGSVDCPIAPVNDVCALAIEAFDGTTLGNNEGSFVDDPDPSCTASGASDIWYYYEATKTGPYIIDTCGTFLSSGVDTILAVYDDCGGNELDCDDDATAAGGDPAAPCRDEPQSGSSTRDSAVGVELNAGQTYFIQLLGFSGAEGDITLNIRSCIEDLNNNGSVDFADILVIIGSWGPCPPSTCAGDLDFNGDVGFSDILVVIGHWGPCP